MTHLAAFGSVLLLGLLVLNAEAQQDPAAGIPVRDIRDVGILERLQIAATLALIPGQRVIAPLYAYARGLACDESAAQESARQHEGSAAIVVRLAGSTVAWYYRTVDDTINIAQERWCEGVFVPWYLATTHPLDIDDVEIAGRYMSRDVERVEARLRHLSSTRPPPKTPP